DRVDPGTRADMDMEIAEQPPANERADDAYDDVADDSETGPLHDLGRQPAAHETDHQDHDQAVSGEHDGRLPPVGNAGILRDASAPRNRPATNDTMPCRARNSRVRRV